MNENNATRVFVYGSLREGRHNHRLLREHDAVRVMRPDADDLFYTEPAFVMLDLGTFPGVTRGGTTSIVGEVYVVTGAGLAALDRLEGHPTFYKREVISLDDGSEAWIYLLTEGKRYSSGPRVTSGDWVSYQKGSADVAQRARTTYFAFGSNLVNDQMVKRCPSAILLCTATLFGHRLDFAGWSPMWRGGTATITPAQGSAVVGALWSISDSDLLSLDRFEGHPHTYRRITVEVEPCADDGDIEVKWHTAWTYRLMRSLTEPSPAYVDAVKAGREDLGLPVSDVEKAVARAYEAEKKRRAREVDTFSSWRQMPLMRVPPPSRVVKRVEGRMRETTENSGRTSDSPRVHPWAPKPKTVVRKSDGKKKGE